MGNSQIAQKKGISMKKMWIARQSESFSIQWPEGVVMFRAVMATIAARFVPSNIPRQQLELSFR